MSKTPDVDIDFADRHLAIAAMSVIPAMMIRNGKKISHPSGIYLQHVPVDPFTKLCALDYEEADDKGYFKIDFLNQSVYTDVRDEGHLIDLLNTEPMWEILDEPSFVEQLPHIHNHFDVIQSIKPRSIDDLAVVLAIIRPGKKHLFGKSRVEIDAEVWKLEDNDGYAFKRSHAISYAALIVVRMNLLCERLLSA